MKLMQISIFGKLIIALTFTTIILLVAFFIFLKPLFDDTIDELIKSRTKATVEIGYKVINNYYNHFTEGLLSESDAKTLALESLRKMKYLGDEYFWVNDYNHVMLMHPFTPEFEGQDLELYEDPYGVLLFKKFVEIVKKDGEGFAYYAWERPNEIQPIPKVSYVKGFEEWNWIVGSGTYIDDINLIKKKIFFGILTIFVLLLASILFTMIYLANRKQIELILRESEENLRITLDSIGDGVIATDINGNITRINPIAQVLTGWSLEDAQGKPLTQIFKIINAQTHGSVLNSVEKVLETGKIVGLANHTILISKNGNQYQISDSAAPIYNLNKKIIGVVLVFRDVTEKYLAEKALEDSEAKYRELTSLLPQVVYEMDATGRLSFVNKMATKFFGYTEDDFENGLNAIDMIALEDRERATQNMIKMMQGGISNGEEYYALRKDGSKFPIIIFTSRIFRDNKTIGLRGIIIDITLRKKVEEENKILNEQLEARVKERTIALDKALSQIENSNKELKQLNENIEVEARRLLELNEKLCVSEQELKEALEVKDRFFSIISHDLRGPFSGFLGLTDLFSDRVSDLTNEEIKKLAISMNQSATNLFKMIEDLFLWSQSQTGVLTYNPQLNDIGLLANQAVNYLRDIAIQKNIEIIQNIEFNTIVSCDQNMISTIFRNLINNAIKFSDEKDRIEIGLIEDSEDNQEKCIVVYVKDNGVGIEPMYLDVLFKVSEKHTTRGTANEIGSGLGLILCKEFIDRHNGKIWVDSEIGKGSTFYFQLRK